MSESDVEKFYTDSQFELEELDDDSEEDYDPILDRID
jgi:hypothetical protein